MEKSLQKKLEALFKEEGFAEIKTKSTQHTFSFTASKGALSAYFQLSEGKQSKGQPSSTGFVSPRSPQQPKNVFVPTVHVTEDTDEKAPE